MRRIQTGLQLEIRHAAAVSTAIDGSALYQPSHPLHSKVESLLCQPTKDLRKSRLALHASTMATTEAKRQLHQSCTALLSR